MNASIVMAKREGFRLGLLFGLILGAISIWLAQGCHIFHLAAQESANLLR